MYIWSKLFKSVCLFVKYIWINLEFGTKVQFSTSTVQMLCTTWGIILLVIQVHILLGIHLYTSLKVHCPVYHQWRCKTNNQTLMCRSIFILICIQMFRSQDFMRSMNQIVSKQIIWDQNNCRCPFHQQVACIRGVFWCGQWHQECLYLKCVLL